MEAEYKPSVLIVDDNPKNLQVLGNTLKLQNYKIEFAISGQKAIEWLEKQKFDIILLDVMMPEMDGYEVCTVIRSNIIHKNMPIIFLTARTDTDGIVKGFEVGAQDYITKPFNTAELLIRVKTQLELKSSREKLESINQWLDNEVKNRTIELAEANQKLEKANNELLELDKAKTDFMVIMSSELRIPMNGILGTLNIIKDQIDSKEMINLIISLDQSVQRLEKFSSYALHTVSFKTRKYQLNNTQFNFATLVEFAIIKNAEQLKQKKVQLENNITAPLMYFGDYDVILNAFILLIENSLYRLNENGKIIISKMHTDNLLEINICDNGIILPKQIIEQNFERYKRDNTYPAKEIGFDFNLIKISIEYLNGTLKINSTSEKTDVSIILPLMGK